VKEERSEGIVLRAIPFSDTKKILTVFMPEEGLVSMATRALSPALSHLACATSPLTCSEFIFRKGRGEVYRLLEATPLDYNLALRTTTERINCAGEIVQILLKTQLPGKPAPLLYDLAKAYIHHIQQTLKPFNLLASFYLKFLKHEGLLHWTPLCAICKEHPVHAFCKGQGTCLYHRTSPFQLILMEKWATFGLLVEARSFRVLDELDLDPFIIDDLRQLLNELVCNE
jgi:DNA repair protein RecO (recombination protein O)